MLLRACLGFMKVLIKSWALVFPLILVAVTASWAEQERCTGSEPAAGYMRQAEEQLWAAEQGDAQAQFGLAALYERGLGVPQNFRRAISWYRKAARQGYGPARNKLRTLGASLHVDAQAEEEVEETEAIDETDSAPTNIIIQIGGATFSPSIFESIRIIFVRSPTRQKYASIRRAFATSQSNSAHGLAFFPRPSQRGWYGARAASLPLSGD